MDAFQSGGFAGKGLIHVGAYLACLGERIPEGRVLSHDALEGAFLRGGYVSDVELTDGFPAGAVSYFARAHRWMRGDVQNLPWLFRRGKSAPAHRALAAFRFSPARAAAGRPFRGARRMVSLSERRDAPARALRAARPLPAVLRYGP